MWGRSRVGNDSLPTIIEDRRRPKVAAVGAQSMDRCFAYPYGL
mgnify:CR=1 FL=1